MPVVKGARPHVPVLDPQRRALLLKQFIEERGGQRQSKGPVIFEILLAQSKLIDLLVVWQEFQDLRSEERTHIIMEAYCDQRDKIAEALGVISIRELIVNIVNELPPRLPIREVIL